MRKMFFFAFMLTTVFFASARAFGEEMSRGRYYGFSKTVSNNANEVFDSVGCAYYKIEISQIDALTDINSSFSQGPYGMISFEDHNKAEDSSTFVRGLLFLSQPTHPFLTFGQYRQLWWDQSSLSGTKARISVDNVEFATGEWNTHLRLNILGSKQVDRALFTFGARGSLYKFLTNQGSAQANEYNNWNPYAVVEYKLNDFFSLLTGHYMGQPFAGIGVATDRGSMPIVVTLGSRQEILLKVGHPFWDI